MPCPEWRRDWDFPGPPLAGRDPPLYFGYPQLRWVGEQEIVATGTQPGQFYVGRGDARLKLPRSPVAPGAWPARLEERTRELRQYAQALAAPGSEPRNRLATLALRVPEVHTLLVDEKPMEISHGEVVAEVIWHTRTQT